jgi:hypothetical protein
VGEKRKKILPRGLQREHNLVDSLILDFNFCPAELIRESISVLPSYPVMAALLQHSRT